MKLPLAAPWRNQDEAGPLFRWAEHRRIRALPFPARRIAIRLGLPPATAQMLAEHAFGGVR